MADGSARTFAALGDGTAVMMRVRAATLTATSWRASLAAALDSPNAFAVIAVAILLDLSAGLAEFAVPENAKDCFGRDNPINTLITVTVPARAPARHASAKQTRSLEYVLVYV